MEGPDPTKAQMAVSSMEAKDDGVKGAKQGPRKRVSQACDKCRSRKDKCDGKKPVSKQLDLKTHTYGFRERTKVVAPECQPELSANARNPPNNLCLTHNSHPTRACGLRFILT